MICSVVCLHWLAGPVDQGVRPGVTSQEQVRVRQLEKENAELRRANAILRTASAFLAAELDRPTTR